MCQRNSFVFNRSGLNCDFQLVRCLFLTSSLFSWLCFFTVGAGDHAPLPADALPAGRDSGGSERRQQHSGETGQEQTASPDLWERRETGPGAEGRQICGVFGSDAGTQREEEEVPCFIGRSKDTWAASTQKIMTLLWDKLADNSDFRGLFYTSRCGCDYSVISHVWFAQCCDKQEVDSSFSLLIWKKDSEKWLGLLELAQNVWGVNAQTQSM